MFENLKNKHKSKPIAGCPGRYTLAEGIVSFTIDKFVGNSISVYEDSFDSVQDSVIYCYFEGGGIIAYRKPSGFLYTLCTKEGMDRKMKSLKRDRIE